MLGKLAIIGLIVIFSLWIMGVYPVVAVVVLVLGFSLIKEVFKE